MLSDGSVYEGAPLGAEGTTVQQAIKIVKYSRNLDTATDILATVSKVPPEVFEFAASKILPPDDDLTAIIDRIFSCDVKPRYPG